MCFVKVTLVVSLTEHLYDDKAGPCTTHTPNTVCDKRFTYEMAFTYHNRIHNIYSCTQYDKGMYETRGPVIRLTSYCIL